jgi:hypothetical protein
MQPARKKRATRVHPFPVFAPSKFFSVQRHVQDCKDAAGEKGNRAEAFADARKASKTGCGKLGGGGISRYFAKKSA